MGGTKAISGSLNRGNASTVTGLLIGEPVGMASLMTCTDVDSSQSADDASDKVAANAYHARNYALYALEASFARAPQPNRHVADVHVLLRDRQVDRLAPGSLSHASRRRGGDGGGGSDGGGCARHDLAQRHGHLVG